MIHALIRKSYSAQRENVLCLWLYELRIPVKRGEWLSGMGELH